MRNAEIAAFFDERCANVWPTHVALDPELSDCRHSESTS